ncbi:MAG: EFR1 family ferrodoxin [Bacteroidota bacterium]|nr:EFR1 family ferrodoxin [Bacteroidota bacterium]
MNFAIFYFSGTGNTKWVSDEINKCITKKGHECINISLEDDIIKPEDILEKADVIGFSFPIYGANMPNLMISFIERLKNTLDKSNVKPVFIVTTAGYVDGYGPFAAKKMLKFSGFKLIAYINLKISNNLSTPKVKANIQTKENLKIRMNKSKERIEKLVNRLLEEKKYIRNIGFYLLPGIIIRKATKKGRANCYQVLSVDKEKCSLCMICVKNCPTKSIIYSEGKFSFLPSCTACMRCYNFCPKSAIYHEGKYADPQIYKRYKGPIT